MGPLEGGNSKLKSFNSRLQELVKTSRQIYDRNGFIYPDWFVGLDILGADFTVANILARVQKIIAETPLARLSNTTI